MKPKSCGAMMAPPTTLFSSGRQLILSSVSLPDPDTNHLRIHFFTKTNKFANKKTIDLHLGFTNWQSQYQLVVSLGRLYLPLRIEGVDWNIWDLQLWAHDHGQCSWGRRRGSTALVIVGDNYLWMQKGGKSAANLADISDKIKNWSRTWRERCANISRCIEVYIAIL